MDQSNRDFSGEMIGAFGEDRFFHAMSRAGLGGLAASIFKARGGEERDWDRLRGELRLRGDSLLKPQTPSDEEMHEILCKVAFTISRHHKEFALKSPRLPSSIHARMVLDAQNDWTRKYAENLRLHEDGK